MILIGQYDSSFVRRVAIALRLYEIPFEQRPWSVFGDADKIREFNPLTRVPTLVLDDGDVLIDSYVILDYIDSLVPAQQRLYPQTEPDRHCALKVAALATGLAEKGVSLFYEQRLHETVSSIWIERCRKQIEGTLTALDKEYAQRKGSFLTGDRIGHADIAVACAWRHVRDSLPGVVDPDACPALAAHCKRLEAMPVFQEISQTFVAPA